MIEDKDNELERFYLTFQGLSFYLGITISAIILQTVIKKLNLDLDYGFNVHKLVKTV